MADADKPNPPSRRRFFRQALKSMAETVDEVLSHTDHPWKEFLSQPAPEPQRVVLRPPGAAPEDEFVVACHRTGECVQVCPVQAIQVMHSPDPALDGTPYIVASDRACVICDDLSCMKVCPSGALNLVDKTEIKMGFAIVEESVCVRTYGEPCTECVDRCPLGDAAIVIDDHGRVQVKDACVGCGVCEFYCPTNPRAIRIVPETS